MRMDLKEVLEKAHVAPEAADAGKNEAAAGKAGSGTKNTEGISKDAAADGKNAGAVSGNEASGKPEIVYEDFDKMEFRVGEIIDCRIVENSKKLLCSQVKIGDKTVQICSGIRAAYSPEQMIGKKVMVIVNLKPRKMAGLESQGMLLCAEDADGKLSLMTPDDSSMAAGSEIC
jgi:methionyl-tRNA synthetase